MLVKILHQTFISEHQYFTARKDGYQLESGKIVDPYFVVELPTSAAAMALTTNNDVILVKQYRYPINENLLEIPGGFIDPGENPEEAIARELLEETGYRFSQIYKLGVTTANPGVLNNETHLFLATGGVLSGKQQLDDNEEIIIQLASIKETWQWLQDSKIKQSMHALCMFYGFAKLRSMGIDF